MCKKVSKTAGLLYRSKPYVPRKILVNLYYSLAYPYFLYANLIWGGTSHSNLVPLVIMQKRLIINSDAEFSAHTEPLSTTKFSKSVTHSFVLAQYMYKQNVQPGEMLHVEHEYNTRGRDKAQLTFQRLTLTQQSISFAGPQVWNSLPVYIRNTDSLAIFRKQ